jgi:hypothetical protein
MFTDRFINVPIKLYDLEHKELTGAEVTKDSYTYINPFEIYAFRPSDENGGECTHVSMKSGDAVLVYVHINEFIKMLNEHAKVRI